MTIKLPISKSIAQRLLMLAHLKDVTFPKLGDQEVLPQDVLTLRQMLQDFEKGKKAFDACDNGTAARFMLARLAATMGKQSRLTGSQQLCRRPMAQLINALREAGAEIKCTKKEGFLPVRIVGHDLTGTVKLNDVISSQFVSAMRLIELLPNVNIDLHTNCHSPYLKMTEQIIEDSQTSNIEEIEKDWSAAAFWYEYLALHPDRHPNGLLLEGLTIKSMQGDKVVKDIFKPLGIKTRQTKYGVLIKTDKNIDKPKELYINFKRCPDLYPAVFITCRKLGIHLYTMGTASLYHKESNRLFAMAQVLKANTGDTLMSFDDHRIAMAMLCADYEVDDTECIRKSYPQFLEELKKVKNNC